MTNKEVLQDKVQKMLARGAENATRAFSQLRDQSINLTDHLVPADRLSFVWENELQGQFTDPHSLIEKSIHDNALSQLAAKNDIPIRYLAGLVRSEQEWKKQLGTLLLNRHCSNNDGTYPIRSVGDQIRGVLSNKYKRLNAITLMSTFLTAVNNLNCMPVNGYTSDTVSFLEVINPEIHEIETPNNGTQLICFGARFRNSDFGNGALSVSTFLMYPVCSNGMVGQSVMRNVHLGKEMPDNIRLSDETYQADTRRSQLILQDIIKAILTPKNIEKQVLSIKHASEYKVDNMKKEVETLKNVGVRKDEVENIMNILMGANPNDNIQGENTRFKISQGIAAMARDGEPERARELQEIGGSYISLGTTASKQLQQTNIV